MDVKTDVQAFAVAKLQGYQSDINSEIARYRDSLLAEARAEYGIYSADTVEVLADFLSRGGKRLRGALVVSAYQMCNGQNHDLAMQLALAVEVMHAAVLVADDVCDRSDMRRGSLSAHRSLERYHDSHKLHGDGAHFGVSQAINLSLLGVHLAHRIIGQLETDESVRLRLISHLDETMISTVHGQVNDIFNESLQQVSEQQVMDVMRGKTSYYSFWNPLAMGAMLAGAEPDELGPIEKFAINAGISFQLADDILGTFGDSFAIGKSAVDDLREGKVTILVARALAVASEKQRGQLMSVLGNPDTTDQDHATFKQILQDTGALDYARRLADKSARDAVEALADVPADWSRDEVEFLKGLAHYITERKF